MPKRSLRQQLLVRRRALLSGVVEAASLLAQRAFLALPEFRSATAVGIYAPIHNEVMTGLIRDGALSSGKRLCYPAVTGNELEFRRVEAAIDLVPGAFGILEPTPKCPVCPPNTIDLVLVPGVAFDLFGRRIGYGKGYYDRTLHSLEGNGRLVGLCFDFQLVEKISGEPHDVLMDVIITDRRVIRPRINHR